MEVLLVVTAGLTLVSLGAALLSVVVYIESIKRLPSPPASTPYAPESSERIKPGVYKVKEETDEGRPNG